MTTPTAAELADAGVAEVVDDPEARLAFLRRTYQVPADVDRGYLPYRRAATAFMRWQLRRGLLNPEDHERPGSPWWRAVNEALLRDPAEASALAFGHAGEPRSPGVRATLAFIERPSALSWYRAHNTSIVSAYLVHEALASRETRVERFFLNIVLMRVLYAHALVAAPRLALGWMSPLGRLAGDPRLGMTGIFLSLSRVLPDLYPLGDDVEWYVEVENGLGHLLDVGVISPRLRDVYAWSADELGLPGLATLLDEGGHPAYAWSPADGRVWDPAPSRLARVARRWIPR